MTQQKKTAKKQAIEKTAAMFEVTSMPSEQLSSAAKMVEEKSGNPLDNIIENAEIEKRHVEELSEAKELGLETEPVFESTKSEIIKALNTELDSGREEIAKLLEEKDDLLKQLKDAVANTNEISKNFQDLKKENDKLSKDLLSLSSELDLNKTDMSREIVDYKVTIQDLQEKIDIYERNESNYKFEITKLKAEIANLETELEAEKSKIQKSKQDQAQTFNSNSLGPMFSRRPQQSGLKVPPHQNGYTSWN